jgi:hypothetical protein
MITNIKDIGNTYDYHMSKLIVIVTLFIFTLCSCNQLPRINYTLDNAFVLTQNNRLIVSTGKVERTWQLTEAGFVTSEFKNLTTGEYSSSTNCKLKADWSYYGLIDTNTRGKLVNLSAHKANDNGFTSDHIEIVAEFEYPDVESAVKYVIWAYPNASGIRTQLYIKGKAMKYIKNPKIKNREDIVFDVISGKNKNNYAAGALAPRYITTTLEDNHSIQIHAKGFNDHKKYKIGFTWSDFEQNNLTQNVRITSVDGETDRLVISNARLPQLSPSNLFETKTIELPQQTLIDGTCRIFIDNIKGAYAQVSEIFIFEEGTRNLEITNGLEERVSTLENQAPANYTLVGYMDCGEAIQGDKKIASGRVDYMPYTTQDCSRTHIAYYNDTQHRNRPETPILKEISFDADLSESENINWSNIIRLEKEGNGLAMVKESHKCANQYGVDTGEFIVDEDGVQNTGTSLFPADISADQYQWCWASWCIAYTNGQDGFELALKQFDRLRYPIDPERDIYIQANTWGSGRNQEASKEKNILLELETQAELGIDIQQIDDGWQTKEWVPRSDWYPEGWKNIVAKSKETGVKLGLWAAAMPVTYEALKTNYDNAHFVSYKLDFANLGSHQNMEKLSNKIRNFIKYTDHKVRVNWDLTENAPRFGYFWAREYGCIYLENRKPDQPDNVVYIPHLVLRDIWQVAKYTNINKFQTTIQNIEMTTPRLSDAHLHKHPYAVAIGLVGTPLFFQETHNYTKQAKDQIKPLLNIYKKYRHEMYNSYVFPIGEEPNNASWTGFQWYNADKDNGFLMIFRELNNKQKENQIALRFIKNSKVKLTDLETGEIFMQATNKDGEIKVNIDNPADFIFLQYNTTL